MGSCISKFKPKRKSQEECNQVQDKLVISNKQPPSPTHSPASTTSVSSFSCTNSKSSSSCSLSSSLSLSSSSSSSKIRSKDRLFSNEFLWSCVKENPHIIHIDSIKGSPQRPFPTKSHAQTLKSLAKPNVAPVKQSMGSTMQKRAHANSPTRTRQKSFWREAERPNSTYSLPSRALRSPSPSRRFSGGLTHTPKESCCKNAVNSGLSSVKKGNLRPASPNNNSSRHRACLMNREMCTYRIGSKIDEIVVGKVMSKSSQEIEAIPMEDIDNPLIALDCFIFL